jgi:hypothetical protein
MKSNEEFIAGIYEKAAVYTEEKETNIIRVNWVAKATRIAAMAAVCIGLAGIGSLVLGNGNNGPSQVPQPANEDYGIALTSETEDDFGNVAQLRVGPEIENVTFTGVVESVDTEEKRITVKLFADESIVYIKWDMMEAVSEDILAGVEISATGVLSEHNGCAELVLTDADNFEIK